MSSGHADLGVQFLLWAAVCMEQSVPLLLPKYLNWRTTLYVAVCESYFACAMGKPAEEFARRALTKITELNELEVRSSSSLDPKSIAAFRQSTVKVISLSGFLLFEIFSLLNERIFIKNSSLNK